MINLAKYVDHMAPWLLAYEDGPAAVHPVPGKWSAKELLGHLIDSAANNHQRLVRGQFSGELGIEDYDQDEWVRVQIPNARPWADLVRLWHGYNLHLAHGIAVMPADIRYRIHPRTHWWRVLPETTPCTLNALIERYEVHLVHHMEQIRRALPASP